MQLAHPSLRCRLGLQMARLHLVKDQPLILGLFPRWVVRRRRDQHRWIVLLQTLGRRVSCAVSPAIFVDLSLEVHLSYTYKHTSSFLPYYHSPPFLYARSLSFPSVKTFGFFIRRIFLHLKFIHFYIGIHSSLTLQNPSDFSHHFAP